MSRAGGKVTVSQAEQIRRTLEIKEKKKAEEAAAAPKVRPVLYKSSNEASSLAKNYVNEILQFLITAHITHSMFSFIMSYGMKIQEFATYNETQREKLTIETSGEDIAAKLKALGIKGPKVEFEHIIEAHKIVLNNVYHSFGDTRINLDICTKLCILDNLATEFSQSELGKYGYFSEEATICFQDLAVTFRFLEQAMIQVLAKLNQQPEDDLRAMVEGSRKRGQAGLVDATKYAGIKQQYEQNLDTFGKSHYIKTSLVQGAIYRYHSGAFGKYAFCRVMAVLVAHGQELGSKEKKAVFDKKLKDTISKVLYSSVEQSKPGIYLAARMHYVLNPGLKHGVAIKKSDYGKYSGAYNNLLHSLMDLGVPIKDIENAIKDLQKRGQY